ncbi:tonB-system energizer ExbB [Afipia sp. Root123D2]|uniref:tonB-system energizer ExbB n=1 Tax=Afipia sp. Root123D2 TaxID=1736436 RepID=UPI0009EB5ECE|nr:tonB-system energizer ExbB [Afipia sp. Root123D2]
MVAAIAGIALWSAPVLAQMAPNAPAATPAAAVPNITAPATPAAPAATIPGAMAPNAATPNTTTPNTATPSAATPAPVATAPSATPAQLPPPNAMLPHDLSPWGMFMNADIIVKAVMIGLAFASLVTWTICVAKMIELRSETRKTRKRVRVLENDPALAEAVHDVGKGKDAVARLVQAAAREAELSNMFDGGFTDRVALRLDRIQAAMSRRIARGTGVLATIGATAPFVGLFGTVWGIMNSFIGISQAHTTNLAVVAPGIAEALLATAMGLVAAIPAVVIYNHLTRMIAGYRALLGDASAQVMLLISREQSRRSLRGVSRAAE